MSTLFSIILLLISGGGIFYLVNSRKKTAFAKPKHKAAIDPEAQKAYDNQKYNKEDEKKKLTLQEKIEVSWKFLINIKDQVLNKFSQDDRDKLSQAGQVLIKNGVKYQHDIEREIIVFKVLAKTRNISRPKNKSESMSI